MAPGSNNTCIFKLFICSVLTTTLNATLTSSCVMWKTLSEVRSFCVLGLSRLEFASNCVDLTDCSLWLTVDDSDLAVSKYTCAQCSCWDNPFCNVLFHHSNDILATDTDSSSSYDLLPNMRNITLGKLSSHWGVFVHISCNKGRWHSSSR